METALDWAKLKNNKEIIELLSPGTQVKIIEEENQKLKVEVASLSNDNQRLKTEISTLNNENQRLKSNNTTFTSENQRLKTENANILNENQRQKAENVNLINENQRLKFENTSFKNENEKLKVSNKSLHDENQMLKKDKSKSTHGENTKLTKEIASITNEKQKLEEKAKIFENYLLALKEKTSELTFVDLNDYEDDEIIGKGPTSDVIIVHKKEQEKYVKKELTQFDHKTMKRFLNECEILFKFRHPCIVRVYGISYGDDDHKPSIILSLEPKSLESAINNKELNEIQKNRIAVEIVLGMRYIHKHKFMHRDLKPKNILLSKNCHVRITDFGLAKEEDLETSQSKGAATMRFMAPELFVENESDINYTNKVDVYSFGIILIFIITESYPAFGIKRAKKGVMPKLPETVSSWVRDLIFGCLSPEPENRPAFAEIYEILKTNNFDMFKDGDGTKLTKKQMKMKEAIEKRIMKIEAFEFQHQND